MEFEHRATKFLGKDRSKNYIMGFLYYPSCLTFFDQKVVHEFVDYIWNTHDRPFNFNWEFGTDKYIYFNDFGSSPSFLRVGIDLINLNEMFLPSESDSADRMNAIKQYTGEDGGIWVMRRYKPRLLKNS